MNRILIVDDKEENIYYLQALLTAHGYEIDSARHGAEALVKARLSPPDLVIADLLMPVMDGYTLLRLWKADMQLKLVPFIVYTATYTAPEDEQLALSLGADAFILKPAEPDDFLARVCEVQAHGVASPSISPKIAMGDETEMLKVYSAALIRKLEEKTLQLEESNRALQEDILHRKQVEEELRRKSAFLEAQVNSSIDGLMVVDSHGGIILQNQRLCDLWNIPPHIADDIDDAVQVKFVTGRTKNPKAFSEKVAYLYSHPNEVSRDEIELIDGTVLDRFSAPVKDETGHYYGRIWAFRDVTLERNRELKLAKALEQEKELSEKARAGERAKSEFLAVMSHEVRTPLNGIMGFAELLTSAPGLPPDQKAYCSTILQSSQALLRILEDILDFSRLEAGRLNVETSVFSPRELLEDIKTLLSQQALGKDLAMILTVDPSVPHFVEGDAGRLRQILLNLAGNAIKFTDHGSVTLSLRPCSDPPSTFVFSVKDTGPGLAPENIDHIFQPFTQADSSIARRHGGTGLGLSISRRLAELLGGSLTVESQIGQGAEFSAIVPLKIINNPPAPTIPPLHGGLDASFAQRHPLKILLVEDDRVNLQLLQSLIRRLGYEPMVAQNGREALDVFQNENPDCLLMDLQMPEMDGIEATELIRTWEKDLPAKNRTFISAVTANIFPADRVRCLDAGMNGYLNKPIKLVDLAAMLEQASDFKAAGQSKSPVSPSCWH